MTALEGHPDRGLIFFGDPSAREELERLGRSIWDLGLDYLFDEALRRPVGPLTYPELRREFFGPSGQPASAPKAPATSAEVLDQVRRRVLPHLYNAQHPRSFSYFTAPPLPIAISGVALAAWFQQNVDIFHAGPVAALIEEEVMSWLRALVGFDSDGGGVLTSGGVMANLTALTVARDVHLRRLRRLDRAPRGAELDGVRLYASEQTHFSIARALDMLGFPPATLRLVESDDCFRLQPGPVRQAIADDRAAGLVPFCISAVSGSTNCGSVDLVGGLADVAGDEDLWLHVDAAYGGAARLSSRDASRVPDLERADSVTVDPHKWFFQPIDIGAVLVRRRADLRSTFFRAPEYYRSTLPEHDPLNWVEYSMEGTRPLRALKLWMSWQHLGTSGFGDLVERTINLARSLADRVDRSPDFEARPVEPELGVVCFRHHPPDWSGESAADRERLDRHQDGLQRALEVSGDGWVSTTRLRGATYLRAGVMNHMTTDRDLDRLLETIRRLAEPLV